MAGPEIKADGGRFRAYAIALLLHVILLAVLILGIELSDYRPVSSAPGNIIEAVVLPDAALPRPRPVQPPPVPREDPEQRRREEQDAEKRRQEELQKQEQQRQEAISKAEQQARLKAEQESRRKQAEVAKQKADAEARLKAVEDARLKAEQAEKQKAERAAQQKAAEEAQRKAEAEARQKAAEEAQRKAEAAERARREADEKATQQALEHAIQEELAAEQAATRERELQPLRNAYVSAIKNKVQRNWLRPAGADEDFECKLQVQQLRDGRVVNVRLLSDCGSPTLNDSVIKAVLKSDPLPQAPDPAVFDNELEFVFRPIN